MRYSCSSTKDQMADPAIVQALASQVNPENLGRVAGNFNPNNKNAAQTLLVSMTRLLFQKFQILLMFLEKFIIQFHFF